jgi:predicted TIM-barrel fold metal-dependent hydrolase
LLGDEEDQVVFEADPATRERLIPAIMAYMTYLLSRSAPTAAQELREIETGGHTPERSVPYEQQVAEALKFVLSGAPPPENLRALARVNDEGRRLLLETIDEEIGVSPSARIERLDEIDYDAKARALLSERAKGANSRYIRFAEKLTGYRRNLLAEMIRCYGGDNGVQLFTPSLVDFSGWLDDAERSDLENQILLMERIQRMDLGATHLHGFVAFNPWRQIKDIEAGRSPTAFDLAKAAVEDMGFVGVKLYPPMGFLPIGNVGSGLSYPERAADIPGFPAKLDEALDALYAWAADSGVAVMAHATNSQGAGEGYALRARPDRWAPVFAKYPTLKFNLGHFGRFDEAGDEGSTLNETWEYLLGQLIEDGATVFADMSYFSEALPGSTPAAHRAKLLEYLRAFLQQYDPNCERLMYGSDFAMLAREANYTDYLDSFRLYIAELSLSESACSRLYRDNAVRFLGLGQNTPTRGRLEAYYTRHGLDSAWLSQFNQG